jgi:NifU-like protein involved in Fe-S cluster formation
MRRLFAMRRVELEKDVLYEEFGCIFSIMLSSLMVAQQAAEPSREAVNDRIQKLETEARLFQSANVSV